MHSPERLHLLIEREVDEESAGPRQNHRKCRQRPKGTPNPKLAKRAPVHLGLLSGLHLHSQIGFAQPRLADLHDESAHLRDAMLVTALTNLGEQAS